MTATSLGVLLFDSTTLIQTYWTTEEGIIGEYAGCRDAMRALAATPTRFEATEAARLGVAIRVSKSDTLRRRIAIGIETVDNSVVPKGRGWRFSKEWECWVPDRRSARATQLYDELYALSEYLNLEEALYSVLPGAGHPLDSPMHCWPGFLSLKLDRASLRATVDDRSGRFGQAFARDDAWHLLAPDGQPRPSHRA